MNAAELAVRLRRPWLDPVVSAFSLLGNNGVGIVAVGSGSALVAGEPGRAVSFAALVVGTLVANASVKQVVRRERPRVETVIRAPGSSSFPSSHAAIAAAAAWAASGWVPALAPAFASLALLMALSRIYLGVHHGTDVVAGLALGSLSGVAFLLLEG